MITQLNSKSLENADLKGQIQEKVFVTTTLQSELRRLKGKHVLDNATTITNATTLAPGMFKLDIEPLSHRLKNNRDAHENYLKKTIENTNTICGLVERARKQNPSEPLLDSACKFTKHGSNATDVPSYSSLVNDKLSRLFFDLEVAFQKNTCFIRNLEGVDLLLGSRDTNLYTISLDDMLKTSPISKDGLARGISKVKFQKDLMCLVCALGKIKKSSQQPKAEDTNQEKLYLLNMDLYGPMRVESINGKKYILVIVDDYSRFTWVKLLRSKDEAPDAIIKCIKNIQVRLNATVRNVRTDNGTEFVNETLPARTMLIFSKAPLFLWAEVINTACYTQNRSLIRLRYNKTPYKLMHNKKPDLSFLHVFGSLYYSTNNSEDLGKLNAKYDIGIFVGYTPAKKAFRIYNRITQKIMEAIHVMFDELTSMASKQFSSGPGLQFMTPATSSSGLVPNPIP
ncbi:retrovirus-related pol polyprotein from transposon TNT 1-94 [Tanacetum coccineum]